MYIVKATSQTTHITMYFSGRVIETAPNKYTIHPAWNADSFYATKLREYRSAQLIADTLSKTHHDTLYSVINEVEV